MEKYVAWLRQNNKVNDEVVLTIHIFTTLYIVAVGTEPRN